MRLPKGVLIKESIHQKPGDTLFRLLLPGFNTGPEQSGLGKHLVKAMTEHMHTRAWPCSPRWAAYHQVCLSACLSRKVIGISQTTHTHTEAFRIPTSRHSPVALHSSDNLRLKVSGRYFSMGLGLITLTRRNFQTHISELHSQGLYLSCLFSCAIRVPDTLCICNYT